MGKHVRRPARFGIAGGHLSGVLLLPLSRLCQHIIEQYQNKKQWVLEPSPESGRQDLKIRSIREGQVPGTHVVSWESEIDRMEFIHQSRSRKGFAMGAVIAAEFLSGKTGFYDMNDLVGLDL